MNLNSIVDESKNKRWFHSLDAYTQTHTQPMGKCLCHGKDTSEVLSHIHETKIH